jgi:enediyne biosynthesis protein E4
MWLFTTGRNLLLAVVLLAILIGGSLLLHDWLRPTGDEVNTPNIKEARERQAIPVPVVRFTDITKSAGIHFRHVNGASGKKLLPETMGSGVAFLDYNKDGKQDILFVNSCPWPGDTSSRPTLALYRNDGNNHFSDVTKDVGLDVTMYGMGVTVGDYDNDGWPDIYITGVGGCRLFRNIEGKRFVDVTAEAGISGPARWPSAASAADFYKEETPIPFASSATFLDYDGDGKLDLFVCYYVNWSPRLDLGIDATLTGVGRAYVPPTRLQGTQCVLYRNVNGRRFEDVSAQVGIQVFDKVGQGENAQLRSVGKSLGVIVCDPDEDGWPDIAVANDTVRNFFFHNVPDGKGGRKFEEIGERIGVAYAESRARGGMGIDCGEYRPGGCALAIANFANEPTTFLEQHRPKRLLFADEAQSVGIWGPSRGPLKFGTFFFDYDLDGRLDLLTCNGHLEPEISKVQLDQTYAQPVQLFWNTGRAKPRCFEPVTPEQVGTDLFRPIVGRGAAFADIDGDGDLDLILMANDGTPVLLRNDNALKHHWIRLVLEGDGKRSNRSAIGALVTVEAGGMVQRLSVTAGRGYLSQSELPLTFGLGKIDKVDRITIRWPGKDAATQVIEGGLAVDKEHPVRQQ